MTSLPEQFTIFNYTDYREYLRDYYKERKKSLQAFSYRFFARKAGIKSVGLYKDVVEGRENLGRGLIVRFSKALGHRKRESEYFENMVYFAESRTVEERQIYFQCMMDLRETRAAVIDVSRYEYYSKWYYCALRALLAIHPFKGDYAKLAGMLDPPISAREARHAVKVLSRLGFIKKNKNGGFEVVDLAITTGILSDNDPRVQTQNIITHHKSLVRLGTESYDRFATPNIDMSALTVGVSRDAYLAIKREVTALRKRIVAITQNDENPDRVYQINYQVFPLTPIEED